MNSLREAQERYMALIAAQNVWSDADRLKIAEARNELERLRLLETIKEHRHGTPA